MQRHGGGRGDAGGQRQHRPQCPAPQQVGAHPAAGAPGGDGSGQQQHHQAARADPGEAVLHPGELGVGPRREPVLPARVVGQFVGAPVALVVGRAAEHSVGARAGRGGLGAQRVPGGEVERQRQRAPGGAAQGEPEQGDGREVGIGLLAVVDAAPGGEQQGAAAAGRVVENVRGVGPGQPPHQRGDLGGERGTRPVHGVGRAAGQLGGDGLRALPGGRGVLGATGEPGGGGEQPGQADLGAAVERGQPQQLGALRAEGADRQQAEGGRQVGGELLVLPEGERLPAGGVAVQQQQQGEGRDQWRGGRVGGVAQPLQLLPDAFPQRHLGDLALGPEPGLDLGQREGRAGLGAADRAREVRVPTPPVADGRPADARQPGNLDGADPGRSGGLRHLRLLLLGLGRCRPGTGQVGAVTASIPKASTQQRSRREQDGSSITG